MNITKRRMTFFVFCLSLFLGMSIPSQAIPPGYDSGTTIVWIEGDREMIFERVSTYNCPVGPADAAPDEDAWITVDVPTLDGTNAKAALVFGHAFAQQDGVAEPNGISLFLSKTGTTPTPASENQLVHTKFVVADDRGDEHAMMIIPLDANKDFDVLYRFGEISGPGADETAMCFWGTRLQLLGYLE